MFFHSLRFRLTAWYTLTIVVVLAVSGCIWYQQLSTSLLEQTDRRLMKLTEESPALLQGFSGPDRCRAFSKFVRRHRQGNFYRLVDAAGQPLCSEVNSIGNAPDIDLRTLEAAAEKGLVIQSSRLKNGPYPMRFLTMAMELKNGEVIFLQVGTGLGMVREPLRELRTLLLIFSPIALLAVSILGWFLAGRTLAPVENLTRAMRRINVENLSQRLPLRSSGDELARLVDTFNSMLGRLEESFRKIKQFSGDASHELRTPLTILKGETEVALRWAKTPEEFRKMLISGMEEIDRMSRIIDDLLLLAKSEGGQKPLTIKEMSLSDLLQELYLQGRSLAQPKSIELVLHPNVTEEIRILADKMRLRQVFLNLIANAINYTPDGGQVEISLSVDGEQDEVIVKVSDTGIGIPAEHLPHIFDRFYRVDRARNREDGGTGLGLAIVDSFVKAHGGRVEVFSVPEKGTTFTVFLPRKGPQTPPATP
ncbi:sensor histidine kinase, HAMP domain-containing [Syntrophotalea carbinolica DSM 2380]|uniref:histidine kinase n=1 Tax=Syntrophotalea carbinolica (strain DSM 2380 / NBRC 103641 / GraBd1) TaxID=338963 RepID=Q39ZZ0_SYNC1|nr:heavy metal sensor histidine kinase [Syntrophotalea carbinolica]ABA90317.1 sensor histidine kinase, HAMP domain-containing [Syntrophotalea carbinolica DSM 2380]